MTPQVARYWNSFRVETGLGSDAPFDVFKVGNSVESADEGLALILSGEKTATSCLPEEFSGSRPPQAGDLSVVTSGTGIPGGVLETTEAEIRPFDSADNAFARAYGEWDKTLATWLEKNRDHYKKVCDALGLEWHDRRELVFERFRVIHRNETSRSATGV